MLRFDVNNQNQVAFLGTKPSGERGAFVGDEINLDLVIPNSSQIHVINTPGINNLGGIVARAHVSARFGPLEAILTGSDLAIDVLIQEGDDLFGLPVTSLYAGRGSIDNRGQIAFFTTRFDSKINSSIFGIFLATPVPEPGTLSCSILWITIALFSRDGH